MTLWVQLRSHCLDRVPHVKSVYSSGERLFVWHYRADFGPQPIVLYYPLSDVAEFWSEG